MIINEESTMTPNTDTRVKRITIDSTKNSQIKDLHRKLVALSFTQGNHSDEYRNTLNKIHELRSA